MSKQKIDALESDKCLQKQCDRTTELKSHREQRLPCQQKILEPYHREIRRTRMFRAALSQTNSYFPVILGSECL